MKKITIDEMITYIDEQCANQFSRENKIGWLSELDEQIYDEIIKDRVNPIVTSFSGYSEETSGATELLVPAMFKDVYRYWLESKYNYSNREIGAYNNAMQMFSYNYERYFAWYNRNHISVGTAQFNI